MFHPLYNDKLAPMTSDLGFLECETNIATEVFYNWQKNLFKPHGFTLKKKEICSDNLSNILSNLLPLVSGARLRYLFVPTRENKWTACFDNGWRGGDPSSYVPYLTKVIGCRGVRAVWVPHEVRKNRGRSGAIMFELYGSKPNPILNIDRAISISYESGWEFEESGEPLPFEQLDKYKLSKLKERFTPEMLDAYLKALGIDAFNENFYLAQNDNPAKLVTIKRSKPNNDKEYTLEKAREGFL